jgi:succinyl-diaminopimelate desuccinylase
MAGEGVKAIDEALLTELIQALVRIPTQNPPGHEKACAEFIHERLIGWGVEAELVSKPYPHRPQVLAVVHGKAPGKTLIFNGHIDVVPEGSRNQWRDDPYGGVLRDGKVYGRGSSDMKGGVGLMMALAKRLQEGGLPRG